MSYSPGARLGPYEIVAGLGEGGMGEVYKARDTRLDRTVAIKRTQERFSDRFQREARAISALNHPNICQLYDVGADYLVMELVDGGPVGPVDTPRKLLDLAVQMADGLSAAHAAGIVHRDLKPDNILVTRDGRVKILDFGLATDTLARAGGQDTTKLASGTAPGTILGTVAYMSPEQARGETPLTPQSDQFSLGAVLYEIAGGRRAFARGSAVETMTAIIREEPEPLPPTTPAPLRWVIERLLAKDPADRYESTRDLYRELRQIRDRWSEATGSVTAAGPEVPARKRLTRSAALAAAALIGVSIGAAAVWLTRPSASPPADLSGLTFTPIATDSPYALEPAWAPDGTSIAYLAGVNGVRQIFTRSLGSSEAAQITQGTANAANIAWSPDGAAIYFNAEGALWVVSSAGGAPDLVFAAAGEYAIHPDGKTIVFQRGGTLWVGARGKEPRELPGSTEIPGTAELIGFSPDGSSLAGIAGDNVWIARYPADGPPQMFTMPRVQEASWMPDSRRLVLTRILNPETHTLSMFDTVTGDHRVFYVSPHAITSGAVSRDGKRLAYVAGRIEWDIVEVSAAEGRVRTLIADGDIAMFPDWAPGGTRFVFAKYRGGKWSVDEASASDGVSRRLFEVPTTAALVQLAPDGRQLTFSTTGPTGNEQTQIMLANLSGRVSPLDPEAPASSSDAVWSPDGQYVVYARTIAGQRLEIARMRAGSTAAPDVLASYPLAEAARARFPVAWAPDGSAILTRSGAALFLSTPDFTGERPVPSQRLCALATGFSNDGRALIGLCQNTSVAGAPWQVWSVDLATGRERLVGNVDLPPAVARAVGFSLHPDGTRFLTSIGIIPSGIWMLEGFDPQR